MPETTDYNVIGRRIVDIRPLTDQELEEMGGLHHLAAVGRSPWCLMTVV